MATVNTGLWVAGFDLQPGQQHHWVQDGQTYGRVRWFVAHPIFLRGAHRFVEVVEVFNEVMADGTRRINVKVRNNGSELAHYGVFFAETGP